MSLFTSKTNWATNHAINLFSKHDSVTGQYNYFYFTKKVKSLLSRSHADSRYIVLYAQVPDMQNMITLSDKHAANEQLKEFSQILKEFPHPCYITRTTINVFLLFSKVAENETPQQLATQFSTMLQEYDARRVARYPTYIPKFYGGLCPLMTNDLQGLFTAIDNAEIASMLSKDAGQARCLYLDEAGMDERSVHRRQSADLHNALNEKQFGFYLQPKVNLQSGKFVGAEALARWIKPDGEIIYPNNFIPQMEKDGSVVHLDFMIYEKLAIWLKQRLSENQPVVPVSVNVSRVHLGNPDFAQQAHSVFSTHGIHPSLIEFELSETILMSNSDNALHILNQLKEYGYSTSVDDFGSGYSSLSLVAKIDVDILKLDRGMLGQKSTTISHRRKSVLSSIFEMAAQLHLCVLCEGVETIEQAQYLQEMGCEIIQGYLIARPLPPAEFQQLLQQHGKGHSLPWSDQADELQSTPLKITGPEHAQGESALHYSLQNLLPGVTIGIDPLAKSVLFVHTDTATTFTYEAKALVNQTSDAFYRFYTPCEGVELFERNLVAQLSATGHIDYTYPVQAVNGARGFHTLCAGYASSANWGQYLLCYLSNSSREHLQKEKLDETIYQLQQERNYYQNLYDSVLCGLVMCQFRPDEKNLQFLSANPAALKAFGFDNLSDLLSITKNGLCDLVDDNTLEKMKSLPASIKKSNGNYAFQCNIHKRDGTLGQINGFVCTLPAEEDETIIQISFVDSTNVTFLEDKLKTGAEFYESFYELMGCGILINRCMEDNFAPLRINSSGVAILGAESQTHYMDACQRNPMAYFHPKDIDMIQTQLASLNKLGDTAQFYHRVLCDNGDVRWVCTSEKVIKNHDGTLVLLGTLVDCTQRIMLEQRLKREKTQLNDLFNAADCGIFQLLWNGRIAVIRGMNLKAIQLFGTKKTGDDAPHASAKRKDFISQVVMQDQEKVKLHLNSLSPEVPCVTIEHRVIAQDGKLHYIEATFHLVTTRNTTKTIQCTMVDTTRHKQLEARFEKYYHNIADLMHQSVFVMDYKEDTLIFSSKDPDLTMFPERIEQFSQQVKNGTLTEVAMAPLLTESVYTSHSINSWTNIEYQLPLASGRKKWVSCSFYLVRDEDNEPESGIGCLQDVTKTIIERERLQHLSETDLLTGLLNKGACEDRCQRYLTCCDDQIDNALLIIDVDDFKSTNDTNGHQFGDKVLQQFGERLQELFRKGDIIGRIGGDEFVVLLKNIKDIKNAQIRSESICTQMSNVAKSLNFPSISCSVGIAIFPDHGTEYKQLLHHADVALYEAKKQGKNKYMLYTNQMGETR